MSERNEELEKWIRMEEEAEEVNDICTKYRCIKAPGPVGVNYYDDLVGCM